MPDRICEYCGNPRTEGSSFCDRCGASTSVPAPDSTPSPYKATYLKNSGQPSCFPYNGLIVWCFYPDRWHFDTCTWQFYAGDQLLESITVERDLFERFATAGKNAMDLVWDLFKVAHGEEEVLRLVAQNGPVKDAEFEVRRVESEREEYIRTLTYDDFVQEYHKSKLEGEG